MNPRLLTLLKFLGFLSIGAIILGLVYRSQSAAYEAQCVLDGIAAVDCSLLNKLASDLSVVRWRYLVLLLVIFMISNLFRAWRWQQLIEPLGKKVRFANALWTLMIGYLANLGLPRMGEVVRAGLLGRYEGVPVGKVMGTVVVDRLMDVFCLLIIVGIALLTQWQTLGEAIIELRGDGGGEGIGYTLFIILIGALLIGAIVLWVVFTRFSHIPIVQRVISMASGFLVGLRSLVRVRNKPLLIANTVGIWGCYFLMAYIPFLSFPATDHLGVQAALTVFVFSALGIIIPAPGGMGSYHFMVIQALALYGISGDDALSFANIIFFTVNLGCNVLFGVGGLIILPILNGGKPVNLAQATETPSGAKPTSV